MSVLEKFKQWLDTTRSCVLFASELGEALAYAHNYCPRLQNYRGQALSRSGDRLHTLQGKIIAVDTESSNDAVRDRGNFGNAAAR